MSDPIGDRHLKSTNIQDNVIKNNIVHGPMNIGTTEIHLPKYDVEFNAAALVRLIKKHEELSSTCPIYELTIDQLQSKIRESESRTVIGLENKLKLANQKSRLKKGQKSGTQASQFIVKLQHIRSYQIIFNHVLGLIISRFNNYIIPLLHSGANDAQINAAISHHIVEPLYREAVAVGGMISADLIDGMIYFLTEKCHIEWT